MICAQILDGRRCAEKIKVQVAKQIKKRKIDGLPQPGLAVILVGNNPASIAYVRHKQKACESVGIHFTCYSLDQNSTMTDIQKHIEKCNANHKIHGILLQLPLPNAIDPTPLLTYIHPNKDVDGLHPYNLGCLVQRQPHLRPCTPKGVITLLEQTQETLAGKHAVVIGASNIVGRPMALELLLSKCTVTVCHRFTQHMNRLIEQANILVVAVGQQGIVKSDWIKPGTIVVDVGFNRLKNGKIIGDLEFSSAQKKASWITPVPGGVGPMTVASLLENTLQAAEIQEHESG